ncbi:MAG: type 4a pilus biogenesis protein PilO [Planctomycetes bacterium]|nr:type 4a pilus biogenesis protein PilO [Planctomycetota bacterium]
MRFGFRELIFLVVLLAVPVASWWYVFKPRNTEIAQARMEIEIKQVKLDKLREVAKRIDDIGLAIEQGREAVELIEAKLPNRDQVEDILANVWELAKRNHLNLKSVKSEKPVLATLYMEQPLRVSMTGRFDGFYQFLLEMENLSRITRVPRMKLERIMETGGLNDAELDTGLMRADFTLSIYFEQPVNNEGLERPL